MKCDQLHRHPAMTARIHRLQHLQNIMASCGRAACADAQLPKSASSAIAGEAAGPGPAAYILPKNEGVLAPTLCSELLLEGKRVPDSASDKADCKRHGRLLCCAEHGVQQRVGTDCAASQPKALSLSRSQMVLARRLEQIALACQSSPHADAKLCCQSAHLHMMNSAPLARLMHCLNVQ